MNSLTKSLIYALVLILPAAAGAQYNRVINVFAQEIDSVTAVTIKKKKTSVKDPPYKAK